MEEHFWRKEVPEVWGSSHPESFVRKRQLGGRAGELSSARRTYFRRGCIGTGGAEDFDQMIQDLTGCQWIRSG